MLDKKELQYKVRRANAMMLERSESGLDKMFEYMENSFQSNWSLPEELVGEDVKWIHRVTSTDPHDAIRAGTRSLSTVMPEIQLLPLMDNDESRKLANQVERALKWQFQQASERREVKVLSDIVLSALLYDEVIISVWYLPEQIKILKKWKVDPDRLEHAQRYGDYIIKVHNPRDTIVEYSDLFAERVLFKSIVPVTEVIDYWGERANELADLTLEEQYQDHNYCTVYDYSEVGGHRAVWCYMQEDNNFIHNAKAEGAIELLNVKEDYTFLPISAKVGGTSLATSKTNQRIPLLWSVYNSGQWETQNILETLLASEGLAYSVSPRYAVNNEYDNEDVDMDFRDPARIVNLKRGQSMQDLRPPQLNDGIQVLADRVAGRMEKSTVPKFLQSGEFSGNFASSNLASQSAMKSLTPYKTLAESALAEMFTIMLYWIHQSGKPLTSYVPKQNALSRSEDGTPRLDVTTEPIVLNGDSSFDVKNIYLQVKLTEDAPSDYVAKINAGAMMVERLGYPYSKGLEYVGEQDPEALIELRSAEEKIFAQREADAQAIVNETSLEVMQMQEELASSLQQVQEMIQQLEALAQQQQQQGPPAGGPQGGLSPDPGMPLGPGPDGSVSPQQQAMGASQRVGAPGVPPAGGPGGPPVPSPFPGSNPAEGDISPHQGAPGVGLREEAQQIEGQ